MSNEALTIIAIIASPVIPVAITLFFQKRRQKYDKKHQLFETLMRFRKTNTPTWETVQALNLIDVIFAREKDVRRVWNEYFVLLNNPPTIALWGNKYTELLDEMGRALGYRNLRQLDIDKVYYPGWFGDQQAKREELEEHLLRILKNTESLCVNPKNETTDSKNSLDKK